MKILLCSHVFAPMVGGIETISLLLARGFTEAGHTVTVVTQTPAGDGTDDYPFAVIRCPSPATLWRACQSTDVVLQNNISLQTIWAALFLRRPLVIVHQTWLGIHGERPVVTRIKKGLLSRAVNVSISKAVAESLPVASHVIPNAYDSQTFCPRLPESDRTRDVVFVGRLVPDKGCDLLIDALLNLATTGKRLSLTVVGNGPERFSLEQRAVPLGDRVCFTGQLTGDALAQLLCRHKIIAVPSRWAEPFGIVALEGIGCGCVAIVPHTGGLADAVGSCGYLFESANVSALARVLEKTATSASQRDSARRFASEHLRQHTEETVVGNYLNVLKEAIA